MMNLDKIPASLLVILRKECKLTDEEIKQARPQSLFNLWCEWEGLINYGQRLWNVVECLKEADESKEYKNEEEPKEACPQADCFQHQDNCRMPDITCRYSIPHAPGAHEFCYTVTAGRCPKCEPVKENK